jgi:hypothetical protein
VVQAAVPEEVPERQHQLLEQATLHPLAPHKVLMAVSILLTETMPAAQAVVVGQVQLVVIQYKIRRLVMVVRVLPAASQDQALLTQAVVVEPVGITAQMVQGAQGEEAREVPAEAMVPLTWAAAAAEDILTFQVMLLAAAAAVPV